MSYIKKSPEELERLAVARVAAVPEVTKRLARSLMVANEEYTKIQQLTGLSRHILSQLQQQSRIRCTRVCEDCGATIRYTTHIDYPRHYHRCAECVAKAWNTSRGWVYQPDSSEARAARQLVSGWLREAVA